MAKPVLDDLLRLLDQRKVTYSGGIARFAFTVEPDGSRKAIFAKIDLVGKQEQKPPEIVLDYDHFKMTQTFLSLDQVADLARDLAEKNVLHAKDADITVQGNFNPPYLPYVASQRKFSLMRLEWPWLFYEFQFGGQLVGSPPQQHLAKLGLPLYPDGRQAMGEFFELDIGMGFPMPQAIFVLPDFRARIKSLTLLEGKVSVDVEPREESDGTLRVKFYVDSSNKPSRSPDLPLKNELAEFEYEGDLKLALVHLFSTLTNEDLDNRAFSPLWGAREGIEVVVPELRVKELLRRGEGVNVEFKLDLQKESVRLLQSVVAFANTSGGTIIVGVNDEGIAIGIQAPQLLTKTIDNLISDKCDPPPQYYINQVEVDGKSLILVDVPKRQTLAYQVRDRGCFVRRGRTNRHATTLELAELFSQKSEPRISLV